MERMTHMDQEIDFFPCTEKDIVTLAKVSQQFYPEHYSHIWKNQDTSYYIELSFTKEAFAKDFQIKNILYYLIKRKDEPLGLLKLRKNEAVNGYEEMESLQLEKIYLLSVATGLGIGKKAIDFTKNYASGLDKKVIWLDVMTTSPALSFYRNMGFTTISYYDLDYPGLKEGYREMQRMILPI